jgi:hypothetical protein
MRRKVIQAVPLIVLLSFTLPGIGLAMLNGLIVVTGKDGALMYEGRELQPVRTPKLEPLAPGEPVIGQPRFLPTPGITMLNGSILAVARDGASQHKTQRSQGCSCPGLLTRFRNWMSRHKDKR